MQRGNTWVWVIGIGAILLGGGYYIWATSNPGTSQDTETAQDTQATSVPTITTPIGSPQPAATSTHVQGGVQIETSSRTAAPMSATVTYDGSNFSPKTVTISRGGTITFVSNGNRMWVASDPHPSHTAYAGTSRTEHCAQGSNTAFDQCTAATENYSFTFTKSGTWRYHDHVNAAAVGTVIVQ